jgi:hypothetical protein
MMAKKTARNGKTGVKKLNRKKDTIRDLDARGKGGSVKGGRGPQPISGPVPIPYPNTG